MINNSNQLKLHSCNGQGHVGEFREGFLVRYRLFAYQKQELGEFHIVSKSLGKAYKTSDNPRYRNILKMAN